MKKTALPLLSRNRSIFASLLMAAAATVSQTDKAAAVDLKFDTVVETLDIPNLAGRGPGFSGNIINYTNVVPGVNARVTATVSGANYSFEGHLPNYSPNAAEPNDDASFRYFIASGQTGLGGMTYKIDLFNSSDNSAFVAPELRFLIYDVDGEPDQGESVRIAKGTGLVGYQVGSTGAALIPTENATSYLFSGRNVNQNENDASGAAIFTFQNVNTVTFGFEANTRTAQAGSNFVFSAIDGDLSYLPSFTNGSTTVVGGAGFNPVVDTRATAFASTAVPEPFTIIGTLVGGTAALRMRKKLKADKASIG